MATVVLRAVGTAIGGPVGGMIGSVIGGLIDQQLFGPGDQEGPRLDDLTVTTSTYGTPIPIMYGPTNRVAGNIIWSSDLIETKEEEGGKGGGPTVTTYSYRVSCAIAISGRQLTGLRKIWANNKVIYDADAVLDYSPNHPLPAVDPVSGQVVTKYFTDETVSPEQEEIRGTHIVMEEVRFYPGNGTQDPDDLIESFEGVGNVPAYRHTAYVVIKDLQLADFGNRIPNFEFEVDADDVISVGAVLKDMTDRAGVDNASVFGLTSNVTGYAVGRQAPVYQAVLPLGIAYDFETTEQRGQIRYIRKGRAIKGTVPLTRMRAHVPGDQVNKTPINYKNTSEVGMPDKVSISYRDPNFDYQVNTQTAFRRKGNAINKISQELPIVIDADRARRIADRLLWGSWANKQSASFELSDTWVRISPGDILGIPVFNEVLPMKVVRTTRGNNGITEFDVVYEDPEIYNSQASGIASPFIDQSVILPGDTTFVAMDAPLLRDQDTDNGFYWAATGANDGWRGATIKRSTDGGDSYSKVSDVALRNPIGQVTGTLASGPSEVFDRTNTLTVTLTSTLSELSGVSELLVLNGANAAWVGPANGGEGEIIQFANATLVGPGQYELSTLLRGRLGTEHMIDNHSAGEVFVLLQVGTLGSSDFGVTDWNKERLYKPISILQDELLTDSQTFTNTGVRAKPLSPVQPKGERNGSNDLTITWLRRSRLRQPGLGNGTLPLGEVSEAYEIDILDGATVVRTLTATAETVTYTAAQQTTDGFTPGELITVDIYQISESRGRGYAKRATI